MSPAAVWRVMLLCEDRRTERFFRRTLRALERAYAETARFGA